MEDISSSDLNNSECGGQEKRKKRGNASRERDARALEERPRSRDYTPH